MLDKDMLLRLELLKLVRPVDSSDTATWLKNAKALYAWLAAPTTEKK